MKLVARLVRRQGSDENDGLILGSCMREGESLLKKGVIYEIQQVMGELIIVEVGPCAIPVDYTEENQTGTAHNPGVCWGHDVNRIVSNQQHLLTVAEYNQMIEIEEKERK